MPSACALRYRVGTFLRAGLLRIARKRPRAGRAIKIYRPVHGQRSGDRSRARYLLLTAFAGLQDDDRGDGA